jgi:hypothetical protein
MNETNNKEIAQMKEQYESEKKDREILQLESEKQKLENEKQVTALLINPKVIHFCLYNLKKKRSG